MRFNKILAALAVTLFCQSGFSFGIGLDIGVKSGFSKDIMHGIDLSAKDFKPVGTVPILGEIGFRATENWYVGAYGQFGFIILGDQLSAEICPAGNCANMSTNNIRVGLNARYHFLPDFMVDPWIGLGIGYEAQRQKSEVGGVSVSRTDHGIEIANLQIGLDVKLIGLISFGPFVSVSGGGYFYENSPAHSGFKKLKFYMTGTGGLAVNLHL